MLIDADALVSKAAQISLEMLKNPGVKISQSGKTYGSCEWGALLKELSELRLTDPQLLARLSGAGISRSRLGGGELAREYRWWVRHNSRLTSGMVRAAGILETAECGGLLVYLGKANAEVAT
jgi:hypothetical protein